MLIKSPKAKREKVAGHPPRTVRAAPPASHHRPLSQPATRLHSSLFCNFHLFPRSWVCTAEGGCLRELQLRQWGMEKVPQGSFSSSTEGCMKLTAANTNSLISPRRNCRPGGSGREGRVWHTAGVPQRPLLGPRAGEPQAEDSRPWAPSQDAHFGEDRGHLEGRTRESRHTGCSELYRVHTRLPCCHACEQPRPERAGWASSLPRPAGEESCFQSSIVGVPGCCLTGLHTHSGPLRTDWAHT